MSYNTHTNLEPGTTAHKELFPSVTMFDASTFYNWEQDNVPLHELKQRTDTLLRHAGFNEGGKPTGTVTYTLSSIEDADIGIYDDMDSILDLIPKRLTYPVLVEICTYGKIPSFELADIVTEGDGQLEIVNRQFSYSPGAKLMMGSSVQGEGTYENVSFTTSAGNDDDVHSSKAYWNAYDASSHRFGWNIFDGDEWDTTGSRGFQSISNNSASALKTYACFTGGIIIGGPGCVGVSGYPYDVNNDSTIPSHDVSPSSLSNLNDTRGTRLGGERDSYTIATTRMTNVLYGNHFTNINVRGCLGKITLRNLCVDGANYLYGDDLVHIGEYGFNISNSNIVLEHCAAMRCKRAGVFVKNSDVSIASGMTCYRNYEKESGSVRGFLGNDEYGIGLHAVNSDINFATINEAGAGFTNAAQPNERGNPYNFAKNDVGIFLESSKLHGGTLWNGANSPLRTRGTANDLVTSFIRTFGNDVGLKMESSNITYLGILESFLNNTGIEANNSVLKLTQFDIQDNAIVGFNLDNSKLEYGYKGDLLSGAAAGHNSNSIKEYKRSYTCSRNGQNLIIKNSSQVVPSNVGDLTTNLGSWGGPGTSILAETGTLGLLGDYMHSVGATSRLADMVDIDSCDLPAIVVKNGSFAEFVGLACAARTDGASIKGACVAVTDNSKVAFRGSKHSWTALTCVPQNGFAVDEQLRNWGTAGVLANNNSVVEFTGPTKISRFGVPVLAENGSTVKFGPPTIDGQETIMDLNRFPVSSLPDGANDVNHTKVELHSTRACLVANNNSNIIIKHIGGWANDDFQAWTTDTTMRSTNPDEADKSLSACTSAGYFRFFPNGFTSGNLERECIKLATNTSNQLRGVSLVTNGSTPSGTGLGKWNCTNFTDGGMCVRAVGNSTVDVNGVNFSFEYSPSSTSGVFYDFQGTHRARYSDGAAIGTDPYLVNGESYWPAPGGALTGPVRSYYLPDTSSFSSSGLSSLGLYSKTDIDTYSPSGYLPMPAVSGSFSTALHVISYGSYASNLMMWNIADTSRLHVANVKMSKGDGADTSMKLDPSAACETLSIHGPRGKWANGVALDYFGEGGLATGFSPRLRTSNTLRQFENYGMFRLLLGHRGDLKSLVEVSAGTTPVGHFMASPNAIGGGAAIDQINAAGYQAYTSQALPLSGSDERLVMGLEGGADWSLSGGSMQFSGMEDVFGQGWAASAINEPGGIQNGINWYIDTSGNRRVAVPNMSIPPLHMDWQGYMRNWLDESASNLFTNAKHAASKKVNSLSIYRSSIEGDRGGEGRDSDKWNASFGVGCRSLNLFDLDRLL